MASKKRQLELSEAEVVAAKKELEDKTAVTLNAKKAKLDEANELVKNAAVAFQTAARLFTEACALNPGVEAAAIMRDLEEKYPKVEVSDAARRRNPSVFGSRQMGCLSFTDLRTDKAKEADKKFEAHDAVIVERFKRRAAVFESITEIYNAKVDEINRALHSAHNGIYQFKLPSPAAPLKQVPKISAAQ